MGKCALFEPECVCCCTRSAAVPQIVWRMHMLCGLPAFVLFFPPCQAANAKHALMDLRFYLEVPWPPSGIEQTPTRSDINLFFKFYDWKVGGEGNGCCG